MFKLANIEFLYLLFIIPLLVALFFIISRRYKKRLKSFGDPELMKPLMKEASWGRVKVKYTFVVLAIIFLIFALARPQVGSKLREVKKSGIEIMIAVDVSNSMLAEDFKPSRLERTKFAISQLVDQLSSDRVGLVVFAGDAYVQLPITADVVSAKSFVKHINTSMLSSQGTSIAKALSLSQRSFSSQSEKNRVVILISDGENHGEDPVAIATDMGGQGTKIYTVGIGTPEGAPITIGGELMKDEEGNIVVTKLDEELLKTLALSSGGSYIRATNQSLGLDQIIKQIRSIDSTEFSSMAFDEYNEQFQYLLMVTLLLLMIEFVILERKNRIIERMTLFNKDKKVN